MEQENERPKAYFITGHRGAGKTLAIATLRDHVEMDKVFRFNELLHEATDADILNQDTKKYLSDCEQARHDAKAYVEEQVIARKNIYMEIDGGTFYNMRGLEPLMKEKYDVHKLVLLCNTYEQSLALSIEKCRLLGTPPHENYEPYYERTNFFINSSPYALTGRMDLFEAAEEPGDKPKHLASFDNGKAVFALPEVLHKSWLSEDSQLRPELEKLIIKQNQTQVIEIAKQKTERVIKKLNKGKRI